MAKALGASRTIVIPQAAAARSAAYVITAIEGSQLHLPRLRTRPQDFDPDTRERFMAGALLPGAWYVKAQRFRRHYRAQVQKLFAEVDIILAPATPCTAPKLGQVMMKLGGVELPVRANLGLYTQPISFIGLPVVVAPLQRAGRPADRRADHRQPLQGRRRAARGAASRERGRGVGSTCLTVPPPSDGGGGPQSRRGKAPIRTPEITDHDHGTSDIAVGASPLRPLRGHLPV